MNASIHVVYTGLNTSVNKKNLLHSDKIILLIGVLMITVPEYTLSKLSKTQQTLVITLSKRPALTKQLIKVGRVANISQMLKCERITEILADAGLIVTVNKITREFLWQLSYIQQHSQQEHAEVA